MSKMYALIGLATLLPGCIFFPSRTWQGQVEWPNDYSGRNLVPFVEAGTALAAAAAIRELIKTNPYPHLFQGCSSPEQGLAFAVHEGPTPGLYYVVLEERFDRCGGPRYRVLDWWHVYAVTPQGEVVAAAPRPQSTWEDASNGTSAVPEQHPAALGPRSTSEEPVPAPPSQPPVLEEQSLPSVDSTSIPQPAPDPSKALH